MDGGKLIIRTRLIERLNKELKRKKIAYFGASMGWGKTTAVRQYLDSNNYRYCYVSARDNDWYDTVIHAAQSGAEHIVIDDVHLAYSKGGDISALITSSAPKTAFYIIGRASLPPYLKAFYSTRQLVVYDETLFAYDDDELNALARLYHLDLTPNTLHEIRRFTDGWILGPVFLFEKGGNFSAGFTEEQTRLISLDIYQYADHAFFSELPPEVQEILLNVSHIEELTLAHAQMLCGNTDIKPWLERALNLSRFLSHIPPDKYIFSKNASPYLKWKQEKELSGDALARQYEISALYYTLHDDIKSALRFYKMAGNTRKIAELLLKSTRSSSSMSFFYDLREYFFALPDETVAQYPELISMISMIYSGMCNVDESERYFDMLVGIENDKSSDAALKKRAREEIAYLTISLPHRGSNSIVKIVKSLAAIISSRDMSLNTMSVTGDMPGLVNGGKDFSEWTKSDKFLYKTMRVPLQTVVGKTALGLPDIGIGESLFLHNADDNFTEELTYLSRGFYDAEKCGNIQLQFAALAVMAKIRIIRGNLNDALDLIDRFEKKIPKTAEIRKNMSAFLTNIRMLSGEDEPMMNWLKNEAPDELEPFCINYRYRYMTKVRIYTALEKYDEALTLLGRCDKYFTEYDRPYMHIEALIMRAVILSRLGDASWDEAFSEALKMCEEYRFVRILSNFGMVVLHLLRATKADVNKQFKKSLLDCTKRQAVLYPKYLQPVTKIDYNLSGTERMVLKLLCDGLSNEEIGKIMNISLRTVKFHLSNIYGKMNVKNRFAAIREAQVRKIITQ